MSSIYTQVLCDSYEHDIFLVFNIVQYNKNYLFERWISIISNHAQFQL